MLVSVFNVAGGSGYFSSSTVILTYPGGLSSGQLVVVNNASLYFTLVTIRGYYVLNSSGSSVSGFNVTLLPKRVVAWGPGDVVRFNYTLKTSSNIKPGEYTLWLRVWAYTTAGSLYVSSIPIKVKVLRSPILIVSHRFYVLENPSMPVASYGEHVVFFLTIQNLKTTPLKIDVEFSVDSVSSARTFKILPGKNALNLTLQIPYGMKPGRYNVKATVKTERKTYTFSSPLKVESPILHVNVSLLSKVLLGSKEKITVSLIALKSFTASLVFQVYENGKKVDLTSEKVQVNKGLNVYSLKLPSGRVGEYLGNVYLLVRNWTAFKVRFKYEVYTTLRPPKILGMSHSQGQNRVILNVTLLNPNIDSLPVNITLSFKNWSKIKIKKLLPPGTSVVTFNIPHSSSECNCSTTVFVQWVGGVLSKNLEFNFHKLGQTLSNGSLNSSCSPNTTQIKVPSKGETCFLKILTILTVTVLLSLLVYYVYKNVYKTSERKKKHKHHFPKRRSPLGSFKRPKPPKFQERDSLPKKK